MAGYLLGFQTTFRRARVQKCPAGQDGRAKTTVDSDKAWGPPNLSATSTGGHSGFNVHVRIGGHLEGPERDGVLLPEEHKQNGQVVGGPTVDTGRLSSGGGRIPTGPGPAPEETERLRDKVGLGTGGISSRDYMRQDRAREEASGDPWVGGESQGGRESRTEWGQSFPGRCSRPRGYTEGGE